MDRDLNAAFSREISFGLTVTGGCQDLIKLITVVKRMQRDLAHHPLLPPQPPEEQAVKEN